MFSNGTANADKKWRSNMKYVDIGESGIVGSEISIGCMRLGNLSAAALDRHIHTAVELGINHFDHADIYGGGVCETVFGQVLKNDPGLRQDMIIQSKCGIVQNGYDFSKEHILEAVDGSLRRLGVDYLDTLLLHRPDALMEPEEVDEAFDALENSGKVRSFGVSNFTSMQFELLQKYQNQKLIANQMQLSLAFTGMIDQGLCANTMFDGAVDRDGGILDYCRLHDVTLQAWSPFQYGFFEGVFIGSDKYPELGETLKKMSEKYGVSTSAISAAWILRHPAKIQVIVGTTNTERLRDICTASDITLSRQDWYALYLSAGNRLP